MRTVNLAKEFILMGNGKIIDVKNLNYRYPVGSRLGGGAGSCKEALRGVDFSVRRGEKISIIGPNGAGKSTLMLNLAGLLEGKFRKGRVFVNGKELDEKNIYKIREEIGFVFQDPNDQLFSVKVFDDVAFGLINYLVKKKDRRAKDREYLELVVRDSLRKVNLGNIEDEISHFLSYGEKKLVSLATVLSYDPQILILDEPTGNLDPRNRSNFIKLIGNMKKTIIIATHDLDMAYEFSGRCIVLNKGKIVYDGNPKKVLSDRDFLIENGLDLPLMLKPN
jgi:cobalt/nickel transport system ATP-binding protein